MMTFIYVLLILLRKHLRSTICTMLTFSTNLNKILLCLASVENYFLSGDLNSRIGSKADFIQYDRSIGVDDAITIDSPTPRLSQYHTCICVGDRLLGLCKATNQRRVNGRWSGGRVSFTCLTHNGASVVDYLLTQQDNFNLIDHFSVGDFTTFSNHDPLSFSLRTKFSYNDTAGVNSKNSYYKFDPKHKGMFVMDITNNLETLTRDLNSEGGNGNVNTLTSIFTNLRKHLVVVGRVSLSI